MKAKQKYRGKLLQIAIGLLCAGVVTGFMGQWVMVMFLGGLLGVVLLLFLGTLFDRSIRTEEEMHLSKKDNKLFGKDEDWPHYHDSSYLGSPLDQSPFKDD